MLVTLFFTILRHALNVGSCKEMADTEAGHCTFKGFGCYSAKWYLLSKSLLAKGQGGRHTNNRADCNGEMIMHAGTLGGTDWSAGGEEVSLPRTVWLRTRGMECCTGTPAWLQDCTGRLYILVTTRLCLLNRRARCAFMTREHINHKSGTFISSLAGLACSFSKAYQHCANNENLYPSYSLCHVS